VTSTLQTTPANKAALAVALGSAAGLAVLYLLAVHTYAGCSGGQETACPSTRHEPGLLPVRDNRGTREPIGRIPFFQALRSGLGFSFASAMGAAHTQDPCPTPRRP
jgi:hypothetical protein